MKRMQLILAMVFALLCVCFSGSFAFADSENASAANANEVSCETDAILGTVKIDGRPLHAGEFDFGVKYANGRDDLLSAKNEADGTIDFGKLSFTVTSLDELAQNGIAEKTTIDGVPAWIVYYLVHEKTSGLSDVGVTPHTAPVSLVVTVKDEGNGALSASFRTANELRFDNTYSTGEPVTVFLAGTKDLQVEEGASLVDIEGKFRFSISTKDVAAPMPESTDAGNGQWGRIEFGFITFSLQDLNKTLDVDSDSAEKAGWSRSYVFKYKVTERGSVPGVVNDPETKTVRFKVTDDGKGKLTVVCLESPFTASTAFTFTNRCVVAPDNSANDEIGPGAGDKPLNSNGDADPNAGDVVSPSAGNAPSGTSGGASVSTTAKTGDATLTSAVVLAAVVGLTMAIAGLACGRGRNHKK